MRNPEQVLNILAGHSNEPAYKYERLYRILFNEQMFFVAYQRMYGLTTCHNRKMQQP